MSNNSEFWTFNEIGNDWWSNDLYDSEEEAEAEGRTWAKEQGIDVFKVGKFAELPIPTEIDVSLLFEKLDEQYIEDAEMDDYDFSPYWDSRTPENAEHIESLSAKITEALEEYVEATKITSSCYKVTNTYKVEVGE